MADELNPEQVDVDGKKVSQQEHEELAKEIAALKKEKKKAVKRYRREEELKPFQAELLKLQQFLEEKQRRMIILFEGRDAAGKGGTIRRVTRYMNEKHYRVVALGKPTEEQKTQWYYQKYVSQFPRAGEVVLFDRSWYNRAMVERVFNYCNEKEYYDFMRGVVGFERDLVRQDTILVKLYFSVTKDEQARRFERRKTDPLRQWKLSEVDLQAQDRWDDFTNVKYEMMKRTHTIDSPWTVVRSNDKHLARLNAIKAILNAVPCERHDPSLDFALDENVIVSGSRELEMMDVERVRSGKFSA